ncbi:MAG: pyrroline-5-carboxylate reductase, partial [Pseudomonadota bacterium]
AGLKPEAPPLRLETAPSVILLAVKPQVMDAVLPSVADQVGANTLVMSVAAGKPISLYQAAFPEGTAIIRAMPNTPAAIGKGVTGVIGNTTVNEQHRGLCSAILKTLGDVVWLENEDQMDALTAVSGSGPAYVFHLVEAMTRAGVAAGLPETMAIDLARQTVTGAAALLEAEAQTGADQLRKNVTSPGGTTEAALNVLMQTPGGLSDLMTEAIQAAATRSRELSKD